ncbi:adenosine receptor A1-like [Ptychodera flava]|uniref:adenosine receptor A1-like n=1 Tax=Ptychodera flava TaxID=63121 RepID=UPI00396A5B1C
MEDHFDSSLVGRENSTLEKVASVIYIVLAVFIVPVNFIVIGTVVSLKSLRVPTNWFVCSLSVADLLIGAVVIPFDIICIIDPAITSSKGFCIIGLSLSHAMGIASIVNLIGLTIDRCVAIKWPLRYQSIVTGKFTAIIIAIQWIFAVLYGFAPAMGWNNIDDETELIRCEPVLITTVEYSMVVIFVVIVPTLTFVSVIFYITLAAANRQMKRIEATTVSADQIEPNINRNQRKNFRITKTLFALVIITYIFWLPFAIVCEVRKIAFHWDNLDEDGIIHTYHLHLLLSIFAYLSALINPIVYSYGNRDLKRAIKRKLWKLYCCKRQNSTQVASVQMDGLPMNTADSPTCIEVSIATTLSGVASDTKETLDKEVQSCNPENEVEQTL